MTKTKTIQGYELDFGTEICTTKGPSPVKRIKPTNNGGIRVVCENGEILLADPWGTIAVPA